MKEINPEPTYCPSTNCVICQDRDCNHDVVPPSRVLCYQCNSTADPTCNDALLGNPFLAAAPCTTFKYDDQCFKYWDEETHTGFRGCMSDADEAVALCAEHPERCAVCGDSYCNSDYLIRDARLWCSQCDRTAECLWSYRTPTLPCQNRVAFYETESCYKYLYPSGLKARRGCTLDDEEFCHEQSHHYHGTCDTCPTFFCNGDSFLTQSCVRCNTSESELCEDKATELLGEQCKVDPTYPQRGCFSFRDGKWTSSSFPSCRLNSHLTYWPTSCTHRPGRRAPRLPLRHGGALDKQLRDHVQEQVHPVLRTELQHQPAGGE